LALSDDAGGAGSGGEKPSVTNDHHLGDLRALMHLSRAEIERNLGKYALFVEGRVVAFFESNVEALRAALGNHQLEEFFVLRVEHPDGGVAQTPSLQAAS
jgi:hypothetical protein